MARYGREYGGGGRFRPGRARRSGEDFLQRQGFDENLYSPRVQAGGMRYGGEYAGWGRQGGYPVVRSPDLELFGPFRYGMSDRRSSARAYDRPPAGRPEIARRARGPRRWPEGFSPGEYERSLPAGVWGAYDRIYGPPSWRRSEFGRAAERDEEDRGAGRRQVRSYGPTYGERWESTQPEDIARRNFDRG